MSVMKVLMKHKLGTASIAAVLFWDLFLFVRIVSG
jgi:hypothetical protein